MERATRDATTRRVELIGVSSGRGGHDHRSGLGPRHLQRRGIVSWVGDRTSETTWRDIGPSRSDPEGGRALDVVSDVCRRLATIARRAVDGGAFPIVLGGDHSCAVGTWSGVYQAIRARGPLGLVWIDAHMDSHVPETSPSGNLHGMPVAHLLGHGAPELTRLAHPGPAVLPANLCLIGARSFEPEEPAFLERLGVRVYRMEELRRRGFGVVLREALARVEANTAGFGLSLDLDALDPIDAPGTGSPVANGIRATEVVAAIRGLGVYPGILGFEIAEFNPALDRDGATVRVIRDLLIALLASESTATGPTA